MRFIRNYVPAFRPSVSVRHPHTTWLHFNSTEVKNVYETPVTEDQILGRSLTHAFTVASAYAKQIHGVSVKFFFICELLYSVKRSFSYAIFMSES